jgi:transcriptional regulator with XRE-family HTH domain
MTEKNRIEKVMVHQNMTAGQFAAEIGVQNSTLSHILNNRNNPSLDVLKKILSRFPEISADWLILGQGSMYRQEIQSKELTLFDSVDENNSLSVHLNTPEVNILPKEANVNQNEMLKNPLNTGSGQLKQEIAHRTGKIAASVIIAEEGSPAISPQQTVNNKAAQAGFNPMPQRTATRVIIYFSDNTFQEFESK